VMGSLLVLAGSTADRVGRRRTFQTGLVVFALGSLSCSLAPSLAWLVAARVLQAVGGSMLNPVAMSIITNTFTDARERARAIGVWGGVVGVSTALGPVVGGLLVETVGWRAIFWINVPIAVAAFVACALFVPESRAPHGRAFDAVGQVLVIVLFASLTTGFIEAPNAGWTSTQTMLTFALSAASLAVLVPYELRRPQPLVDPRFFRSIPFSGAVATGVCAFAAFAGFLFLNTLYLQVALGWPPLRAGLATLPMALLTLVLAPVAGRIVGSVGPRVPLVAGGVGLAVGGLLLTRLSLHTPLWQLLLAYVVIGAGFGMVNPPITNSAVSGMPRTQAGVAAAIASTSRQLGQSLGVAVIVSLVVSAVSGPFAQSFPQASHVGWWIVVGCGVVVTALGVLTTTPHALATARRTAERVDPAPAR
jgi:EmrB/QacA subfamily drug resistance transporter